MEIVVGGMSIMSNSGRSAHALGSRLLCGYLQMGRLLLICCTCPVILNLPRQTHEGLLHISASLGTDFQEEHVMFLSQFLCLLLFDFAIIHQIGLGTNKYLADCLTGVALNLLDPAADILEGLLVIHPVGQDDATGSLVVGLRYIAESFLPCSIPNLQADLGVIDSDGLDLEVHPDSSHVAILEDSITELSEQVGLAHSAVSNYDHLGQ